MSRFARLNAAANAVAEIIDIDPEIYAALLATGNPKAQFLRPLVTDAAPTPTATQHLVRGPVVIEPTQARETWLLVDKTADELAAETAATDRAATLQQLKALQAALQAGTGTAAERLARLEKVAAFQVKEFIRGAAL